MISHFDFLAIISLFGLSFFVTATQASSAFRDFAEYRRSSGETFPVHILEFEKGYRDVEKHDMKLPTDIKTYFIQAANVTTDNERLARATAKLDYDDMKNQIQKVFGKTAGNADDKTEECNCTSYRTRWYER